MAQSLDGHLRSLGRMTVSIAATRRTEKLQLSVSVLSSGQKSNFAWPLNSGSDISASWILQNCRSQKEKIMLHLIWYIIVGFLAGCVAKALLHTHLSLMWTVILGIVGSIVGGAVTHLFYPPSAGGRFHPGGLIVSILGAILVLYLWHRFHLQVPRM